MAHDPDMIDSPPEPAAATWDALRRGLAKDVDRVCDRLRTLSQARLAAVAPPYASRAAAARATAQALADAAAGLAGGPVAPAWRTLPELDDFVAGDQLAVTGHDLVAAAQHAAPDDDAWTRHGRRRATEVLRDGADALAALRRLL